MASRKIASLKKTNYEIFIVILTFLSWFNLILYFASDDAEIQAIIFFSEQIMTPIFLLDVFIRSRFADSPKSYFFKQFGWLDLLGSFPYLRFLRIYRVVEAFRSLNETGSKRFLRNFLSNRAETAVLTVTLAVILLFEFGSIGVLKAEQGARGANIETSGDAIWWTLVTVATVGYGDYYPVTTQGRFIASFVIVAGVGLFSILSGFLASKFLGQKPELDEADRTVHTEQANLETILSEIKELRREQQQANESINTRLNSLEQHIE